MYAIIIGHGFRRSLHVLDNILVRHSSLGISDTSVVKGGELIAINLPRRVTRVGLDQQHDGLDLTA
jgi:hypothetical protein